MNIGIDFDDVLTNTNQYIIEKFNKAFDTKHDVKDFKQWEYSEQLGLTSDQLKTFIDGVLKTTSLTDLVPVDTAYEAVPRIAAKHNLAVITARHGDSMPFINKWLQEYFPGNFHYMFCTNHMDKSLVMPHVGIQLLVDDSEAQVDSCYNVGLPAILYDRPHNRHFDAVHRVNDWYELEELLDTKEFNPNK
jgi:5'(3')-deoxyribonucleotidase